MTEYVIKLRGLPWSCTKNEINTFLKDCNIVNGLEGIHLVSTPEGRASGEAFVELETDDDVSNAVSTKDCQNLGHRYIEVFRVKRAEMEWILKRSSPKMTNTSNYNFQTNDSETFVRLRGLPFECTKEDIVQFFDELEIHQNGIQLMVNADGRSTGEAYVQFCSTKKFTAKDMVEKALAKDRQCIGHRYIEIFRVSPMELRNMEMMAQRVRPTSYSRAAPYDINNRPGAAGRSFSSRGNRYFNKEDNWDNYNTGYNGRSMGDQSGSPMPLMPGLKRRDFNGGGGAPTGYAVFMRGIPYRCTEDDIIQFFEPLLPSSVHIIYETSGRPSGNAKVYFHNKDDATRALGKHKDKMKHRYIEIFAQS